jgi:hypothetical protein
LKERALRFGVPILVFSFLIGPIAIIMGRSGDPASAAVVQSLKGKSFGEKLVHYWHLGVFNSGPLWFAEALLIFTLAYLAWRALASRLPVQHRPAAGRPFPSNLKLAVAALATGAAAFAVRIVCPIGTPVMGPEFGNFSTNLGYFPGYIVLFAAGCAAAPAHWLTGVPDTQRRVWRIVALCALPVLPAATLLAPHVPALQGNSSGGWNAQAAVYAFWEPLVAWGLILALLQAFARRFVTLGPVWATLARRAFAIYIIHPPVVVAVALVWRQVEAPHLVKFALTGALACLACFRLAGLLLRVPWIKRIV